MYLNINDKYFSSLDVSLLHRSHADMVCRFSGYGGTKKVLAGMWSDVVGFSPQ
jgi:hypothetical protein